MKIKHIADTTEINCLDSFVDIFVCVKMDLLFSKHLTLKIMVKDVWLKIWPPNSQR